MTATDPRPKLRDAAQMWKTRCLAAEALVDESIPDKLDRLWDAMADAEPADLVQFLDVLANAKRAIEDVRKQVEAKLATDLGTGSHLVDACEVRVSNGSPSYKQWDNEALVRAVLDSRLVDDEGTVADESPADKLRHCFNLSGSNVRRDALRARKLDPADFCLIERKPAVSVIR